MPPLNKLPPHSYMILPPQIKLPANSYYVKTPHVHLGSARNIHPLIGGKEGERPNFLQSHLDISILKN